MAPDEIDLLTHQQARAVTALLGNGYSGERVSAAMSRSQLAPLTFQQESALAHPEPNFFGLFSARLSGPLKVSALRESFATLIQRHESLRSRIVVVNGYFWQEVVDDFEFRLDVADLTEGRPADVHGEARRAIEEFAHRWVAEATTTFDARLWKLSDREYVLAVIWDHLFEDYTSALLTFRELWGRYRELSRGTASSDSTLPAQYRSYAIWQREQEREWSENHASYWRGRLAGSAEVAIPTDTITLNQEPFGFRVLDISLDEMLSQSLQSLARREGVLPAMVILTAYVAVLVRWSGKLDFLLPFYVSGRHHPEHLNIVGFMAHPLPLRIELNGRERLVDLLRIVSGEFVNALRHLDIGKTVEGTPDSLKAFYFQWFNLSPIPDDAIVQTLSELSTGDDVIAGEPFPVTWPTSTDHPGRIESPIITNFWCIPKGVVGKVTYRRDLFTTETMSRFLRDLRVLAEHTILNSGLPVLESG